MIKVIKLFICIAFFFSCNNENTICKKNICGKFNTKKKKKTYQYDLFTKLSSPFVFTTSANSNYITCSDYSHNYIYNLKEKEEILFNSKSLLNRKFNFFLYDSYRCPNQAAISGNKIIYPLDKKICIFNPEIKKKKIIKTPYKRIQKVFFSKDGSNVIIFYLCDNTVLFDLTSTEYLEIPYAWYCSEEMGLSFSPDNKNLILINKNYWKKNHKVICYRDVRMNPFSSDNKFLYLEEKKGRKSIKICNIKNHKTQTLLKNIPKQWKNSFIIYDIKNSQILESFDLKSIIENHLKEIYKSDKKSIIF